MGTFPVSFRGIGRATDATSSTWEYAEVASPDADNGTRQLAAVVPTYPSYSLLESLAAQLMLE